VIREVREELRHLDASRPALRKFGLVVGGVFVGIAAFVAWRRGWEVQGLPLWLGAPGLALVVLGALVPGVLLPVYRVWMGLAFAMGFVMTRVILTVVFVGMVIPIGLVMRLVGKDPLDRQWRAAASYWRTRPTPDPLAERLGRMY
jgi:hypothetical protein